MNKKIKSSVISFLIMVCIALYPIVFMYCQNVTEADLPEIAPLLIIFPVISVGIWLLCLLFFKAIYKSAFINCLKK